MAERVGQSFGNYQLLRLLGRGAFAEVYLAEHRYLEVPAAIKVLHVRMELDTHEQFLREARTIAHLQHPHILRVFDFGFQDQTPFLVMEYTPNGTLRTRHPKGTRLPLEQIVTYVKQIALALDYAHQQRVIHRDVKPENMLLSATDEVVLSDFGIAVVQQSLDSLSTQNQAGTPVYMAPEQIQRKPCAASDQYALGVLVYEWLCGESPFRGSLFEVLSQHLYYPPPSLCARLPSLPPAVEDAVFGALAKDPQARFASVQDFAEVLEAVCEATQTLALRVSSERLSREQSSPHEVLAASVPVPSSQEQARSSSTTQPLVLTRKHTEDAEELVPASQTHGSSGREGAPVSQTNRQRLLRKVRAFWIAGVFEHSLHGAALLALGLEEQPDAVANPWQLVLQHPAGAPRPLSAGTHIKEVYDAAEGELLILGAPGSGKTILLLELARELLSRAERNEHHPLPVVFNLSSWASKQQRLADWLVEELNSTYQVPRKLGQTWVEADQILPLLDGLDEVAPKDRTACIETINTYRQEHGLLPLVVCSRSADYLAQAARIQLGSAVAVQPLTQQQVDDYLASGGEPLWALRVALSKDAALRELTNTPLMLSILTLTYQGVPVEDLLRRDSITDRQRQIFEHYVERMLRQRGGKVRYTDKQTTHWLTWLARQMKQQNQTVFYIEHLQPDWLENHRWRRAYGRWGVRLPGILIGILVGFSFGSLLSGSSNIVLWLFFGPIGGLLGGILSGSNSAKLPGESKRSVWRSSVLAGLIPGLSFVLIFWLLIIGVPPIYYVIPDVGSGRLLLAYLIVGLIVGLIGVFLNVILGGRNRTIQPAEIIVWSKRSLWQSLIKARHLRNALLAGLSVGLSIGLINALGYELIDRLLFGTLDGLRFGLASGLSYGLGTGLSYWLLLGLFHGVSSSTLDDRHRIAPNEGIRRSAQNSFLIGLISGCISGIFSMLSYMLLNELNYRLIGGMSPMLRAVNPIILSNLLLAGLVVGLPVGLLAGLFLGGLACIRHGVLRWLLWRVGSIPWNYPRFLDYAAERNLLRKVGGGYIFVHRLLLEYFASLDNTPPLDEVRAQKQQVLPVS